MLEIRDISAHQRLGLLDLNSFAAENHINVKREIERAGTQTLLTKLLNGEPYELSYTEHKKPFLKHRLERISISHSHDLLVVLINAREETGVDIELLRDKVLRIKHKFLNKDELTFAGNDVVKLISLWAAKEAMYKAYGRRQLDFKLHMSVAPFSNNELRGSIKNATVKRDFFMKREQLGEYMLVYILYEVHNAY